jgi:hypothetical protein
VIVVVEVAGTTVKLTGGLVTPEKVAVISLTPTATALTEPLEFIVATMILELTQFTSLPISWSEPSEYSPMA